MQKGRGTYREGETASFTKKENNLFIPLFSLAKKGAVWYNHIVLCAALCDASAVDGFLPSSFRSMGNDPTAVGANKGHSLAYEIYQVC